MMALTQAEQRARARWWRSFGLIGNDIRRLEFMLCALADYEIPIRRAVDKVVGFKDSRDFDHVRSALRHIVHGWEEVAGEIQEQSGEDA